MFSPPDHVTFTPLSPFWKRLLGLTLAERYRLRQILRGDDAGVFFLASVDAEPATVILKLVPEDDGQLDLWERVRQFEHPHLLRLLDCGRTAADGDPFVYAAFESPDESAAAALEQTAMSAAEVRQVLPAVASALRYLHENGCVHTAVSPEQIVAVGDCIKLTTDPVRQASPRHSSRNDVWDLGATLYELMTRRKLGQGDEFDLGRLEEPFPAIVQQALTGAASLEDLVQALDAPPPPITIEETVVTVDPPAPLPRTPIPIASQATDPFPSASASIPAVAPPPAHTPIADATPPPRPAAPASTRIEAARNPIPRWAFPAAGAVILLVVFLAAKRPESQPVAPVATSAAPARSPAVPETRERTVVPPAVAPAGLPAAPLTRSPAAPPPARETEAVEGRPFWRVVAYTYAGLRDAQERARRINQQWPEFHAAVFTPRGPGKTPYMVALGGRMSKPDAIRLQQRARASGLPRDTFVRNYSE